MSSDNLDMALLQAQKNAEGLKKDGKNQFAKFDYVSAENVVKTARKILHENGLVFSPTEQVFKVNNDGVFLFEQRYSLTHAETGESRDLSRTVVLMDEKGKSISQAQGSAETYVLKNILRELLLIPRFSRDEDLDSYDNTERTGRTAGNPAKRFRK